MASMQALINAVAPFRLSCLLTRLADQLPVPPPSICRENQALYAFDMHNGKLLWQFAYGQYLPNQDLATFLVGAKSYLCRDKTMAGLRLYWPCIWSRL